MNSRVLTAVYRLTQLACVGLFVYGCSQLPNLARTFSRWQNGIADSNELPINLLKVTLPVWMSILLIGFCERNLRLDRYAKRMLATNPDSPWLANPSWKQPILKTSKPVNWLALGIGLISILLILGPVASMFVSSRTIQIVGVVLLLLCISFALNQWRTSSWRNAQLNLMTFPGVIGGTCYGVFTIQEKFSSDTIFSIGLQCTYLLPTSVSDETDNTRRMFWSASHELKSSSQRTSELTELPIHFTIPTRCPPSTTIASHTDSMRDVRWELLVHRKNAAGSGMATFRIPIYRTFESRSNVKEDQELLQPFRPQFEATTVLQQFGFKEVATGPDAFKLIFQLRRNADLIRGGLLLSGVAIAAMVAIILFIPIIILQLFLAFLPAMMLLAVVINCVEQLLWKGEIVRSGDEIKFRCGIPGYHSPLLTRADCATKLFCRLAVQSQNQVIESWNLFVMVPDGQERLLLRQFGSRGEAEQVQSWLADRLGIGIEPITVESMFSDDVLAKTKPTQSVTSKKAKR